MSKIKKISGKSMSALPAEKTTFKPIVYLDGKQIPKELAGTDIGKTMNLAVKAKLVRRTEESGGQSSVCLELQSIGAKDIQQKASRKGKNK